MDTPRITNRRLLTSSRVSVWSLTPSGGKFTIINDREDENLTFFYIFFTSGYSGQVQVDGTPVRIQLMDTAGQVIEQFHLNRLVSGKCKNKIG